jgi:hypothetical protein
MGLRGGYKLARVLRLTVAPVTAPAGGLDGEHVAACEVAADLARALFAVQEIAARLSRVAALDAVGRVATALAHD